MIYLFYIDNILNINDINDQKPTVVLGFRAGVYTFIFIALFVVA